MTSIRSSQLPSATGKTSGIGGRSKLVSGELIFFDFCPEKYDRKLFENFSVCRFCFRRKRIYIFTFCSSMLVTFFRAKLKLENFYRRQIFSVLFLVSGTKMFTQLEINIFSKTDFFVYCFNKETTFNFSFRVRLEFKNNFFSFFEIT